MVVQRASFAHSSAQTVMPLTHYEHMHDRRSWKHNCSLFIHWILLCVFLSGSVTDTSTPLLLLLLTRHQWDLNKVTHSVLCEISKFLIEEPPENTNYRCPSISEAELSVAESSMGLLVAAISQSGRSRTSSRDTLAH